MPKPAVLPLSEVFNAIDKKDYNWYKNLSAEKRKHLVHTCNLNTPQVQQAPMNYRSI